MDDHEINNYFEPIEEIDENEPATMPREDEEIDSDIDDEYSNDYGGDDGPYFNDEFHEEIEMVEPSDVVVKDEFKNLKVPTIQGETLKERKNCFVVEMIKLINTHNRCENSHEKYLVCQVLFQFYCDNIILLLQVSERGKIYKIVLQKAIDLYTKTNRLKEKEVRIFIDYFYKLASIIPREQEKICKICYENEPELMPCGHFNCCWKCLREWGLKEREKIPSCPFCRQKFSRRFFVEMWERKKEEMKVYLVADRIEEMTI